MKYFTILTLVFWHFAFQAFATNDTIKKKANHSVPTAPSREVAKVECGIFKIVPHGTTDPTAWTFETTDLLSEGLKYQGCVTRGENLKWQNLNLPGFFSRTAKDGTNRRLGIGDSIEAREISPALSSTEAFPILSIGGESDLTKETQVALPIKPVCINGNCLDGSCGGGGDETPSTTNCTAGMEPMNASAEKCVPEIPVGSDGLRALLN